MWRLLALLLAAGCEPAQAVLFDTLPSPPTTPGGDTGEETGLPMISAVSGAAHDDTGTIIVVEWTQRENAAAAWIAYTHDGADGWLETPPVAVLAGQNQAALLGIPADRDVTFEIYAQVDGELVVSDEQYAARTDPLPVSIYLPDVRVHADTGLSDEGYLLVSLDIGESWFQGPYYVLILNRDGEVVWYRETANSRGSMFPRVSRSGDHLVIDETTLYTFSNSLVPTVSRLTLDQRHETSVELPNLHYTYDELDDGSFIYGSFANDVEFSLERLYPDGSMERVWDCYPWMRQHEPSTYWACAANTVLWRPETNTVLWSMFETSTVAELDLRSGELVRHFGQIPDGYAFDPPESVFDLQHYPNFTRDGTLMVSTHIKGDKYEQRAREFVIDDAAQVLREVWSYGEDSNRYARYAGEATRLDNGNVLMNFGTDGVVQELTDGGEVLWELEWRDRLIGHTTLIADLYALNQWDGEGVVSAQ